MDTEQIQLTDGKTLTAEVSDTLRRVDMSEFNEKVAQLNIDDFKTIKEWVCNE